ncbi:ribonuclease P protein subunit Rpp21 [Methanolobus vulcani]|jgi:ribonuclease P protein subunit RPR2|uniref:Ribonuclease P protein component 4 n=1 Tax=Methanolobus vulcani TaxID=38026 RepID=A0A7Z7AYV1_9EURY|nr:ribonuclease P protein component 4 [Methanolobus vulcani]SDG30322.1 ribonuclease P protein subunit Rpp21 [Methanolobus vulcani]
MAKSRKKNKAVARSIAQERIEYLFDLAKGEFSENPELSKRYVSLARKIGMRHRVSIPSELKISFCKNCGSLLLPGNNSRVRLKDASIIITCLDCGNIKRYPFDKEKKG